MKFFHSQAGKGRTVGLPNDILNVEVSINGQDVVNIYGTHSGDGRVGTTEYTVGVEKGRVDSYDEIEHDDFEYIKIVERGMWRGNMRVTVVTLSEVDQ